MGGLEQGLFEMGGAALGKAGLQGAGFAFEIVDFQDRLLHL
jgi:hypothetical protein